jgi:glycosyltransferase involved in cell wall biosynthesis
MAEPSFSVLLPTYSGETPHHLDEAIKSIINQTITPSEVVLVKDGPLNDELDHVIRKHTANYPDLFTIVELSENSGVGTASRIGLKECSGEFIALMDSDDVSLPKRFEIQLDYFEKNPQVDVLGGFLEEYSSDLSEQVGVREVPTDPAKISRWGRFRSPINNVTAMFRRQSVLEAGNYRDYRMMQDYELWARLLANNYILDNIPKVLVKSRADADMHARRGGIEYAQIEVKLQQEFYRMGFINAPILVFNLLTRAPLRLFPNVIRSMIYSIFLRD